MLDRRLLLTAALAAAAASPLAAQPVLIKNIHDGASGVGVSSSPQILGAAGGHVVFAADDLVHGKEPWATDGSVAGTRRLADFAPGGRSSETSTVGTVGGRLVLLTAVADAFTFEATMSLVWSTDGTAPGTTLLVPGQLGGAEPYFFGWEVGSLADPGLLFFGLRAEFQNELWVTDGTPEGTRFLAALSTEAGDDSADLGDRLLFEADFGHLWVSDGTAAGTRQVLPMSFVQGMAPLGDGRAILVGFGEHTGSELWVSDGTAAGTHLLRDLVPGPTSSSPTSLVADESSGIVYFFARDDDPPFPGDLWRTDGTSVGTIRLTDGLEHHFGAPLLSGGKYFTTSIDEAHGMELLVSDGTIPGTRLLDLCPGPCWSSPNTLRATSVGLVFFAEEPGLGSEPWTSDGTLAGTRRLADLCPGSCTLFTQRILDLGGRVVGLTGFELWASDGTPAGTGVFDPPGDIQWTAFDATVAGGVAVLAGDEFGTLPGHEPWRTDGTAAGTFLLGDLAVSGEDGSDPARFTRLGDRLFFSAGDGAMRGLWSTDGSPAGTGRVVDLATLQSGRDVTATLAVGEDLFFVVEGQVTETELWRSDGTPAGTVRLLLTPFESGRRSELAAIGDTVYLLGPGLWRSGRVPGSAVQLADLGFPDSSVDIAPGVLDGRLYFSAASAGSEDFELWVTDGTAAGTRRVRDVRPGVSGSSPFSFAAQGGTLYFVADHDSSFAGLWSTDGTEFGTRLLLEFDGFGFVRPRMLGRAAERLVFFDGTSTLYAVDGGEVEALGSFALNGISDGVDLAGRVYFVLYDESFEGGFQGILWSTDGSPAGTARSFLLPPAHQVVDLWDAGGGGILLEVTAPYSRHEFWRTDGTAAGTHRVADLGDLALWAPSDRRPGFLDGQVLFAASTPPLGTELWGADLDAPAGPFGPPPAPSGLTAESVGESSVLLTWQDLSGDETAFRVRGATFDEELGGRVDVPAGATSVVVHGLPIGVPYTFTVAAVNTMGVSPESGEASATPLPGEPEPCAADGGTLCLLGGRFGVSVVWRDQHNGGTGVGGALPLPGADRTGRFWFFHPDNVELIVKALDGRPVNGAFWSFFGALSDVEYWVTVVDSATGRSRTYHNRPGEICGVPDTEAFPQDAGLAAGERAAAWTAGTLEVDWPATAPPSSPARRLPRSFALPSSSGAALYGPSTPREGTCVPGAQTLCLLDDRLRVEVSWHDQHNGGSGTGQAVPGSEKTGYFWFFNADNLELVVKALDGTPVNGHLWLFYGALSDVEYTITVTDTVTQAVRSYHNPPGEFCGRGDTAAF